MKFYERSHLLKLIVIDEDGLYKYVYHAFLAVVAVAALIYIFYLIRDEVKQDGTLQLHDRLIIGIYCSGALSLILLLVLSIYLALSLKPNIWVYLLLRYGAKWFLSLLNPQILLILFGQIYPKGHAVYTNNNGVYIGIILACVLCIIPTMLVPLYIIVAVEVGFIFLVAITWSEVKPKEKPKEVIVC